MYKNIFAHTEFGTRPGYISVNSSEGLYSITVRSTEEERPSVIYLTREQLTELAASISAEL